MNLYHKKLTFKINEWFKCLYIIYYYKLLYNLYDLNLGLYILYKCYSSTLLARLTEKYKYCYSY